MSRGGRLISLCRIVFDIFDLNKMRFSARTNVKPMRNFIGFCRPTALQQTLLWGLFYTVAYMYDKQNIVEKISLVDYRTSVTCAIYRNDLRQTDQWRKYRPAGSGIQDDRQGQLRTPLPLGFSEGWCMHGGRNVKLRF